MPRSEPSSGGPRAPVRMTLFVAGGEENSRRAQQNLARLCEQELNDNYTLDVVDVLEDFQAATRQNVMVTPTLIVAEPPPKVTILGDLRDMERLRAAFGLD